MRYEVPTPREKLSISLSLAAIKKLRKIEFNLAEKHGLNVSRSWLLDRLVSDADAAVMEGTIAGEADE